jgi:hypothetical protein
MILPKMIEVQRVVQWANFRGPSGILYSSPMYAYLDEGKFASILACSTDISHEERFDWIVQSPDDTFLGITPCTVEIYVGKDAHLYYSEKVFRYQDRYYTEELAPSIPIDPDSPLGRALEGK